MTSIIFFGAIATAWCLTGVLMFSLVRVAGRADAANERQRRS